MSKHQVDSVIKSYGTKQILTDVYLTCETGEIVGLLGRNGSGKTTLLKIIFGSIKSTNKYVKVDHKITNGVYSRRYLINYLPQDNFLPKHIKIKTIISTFCNKNCIEQLNKNSTLSKLLNRKTVDLSTGEKRLLEIYLTIYSQSKFILLDEPFNGVAPIYKEEIKEAIMEESKYKGFIITDHDYRNILDVSTRLMIIYDGGTKEINHYDELKDFGYLPEI